AVSAGLNDGAQQGAISKGAQRGPVCCSLRNRGSVPGGGDALALAIWLCVPGLRRGASQFRQDPGALPVYRLSTADIRDRRNDFRGDQGAAVHMVSRHVPPAQPLSAGMSSAARIAATAASPTTHAGPEAVLAYLARYTHRVAISNSRLVALDERGVTFRYKDYRRGQARYRTMTLSTDEFIRRFLLHVLPKGFHRIRHYGLLASASSKANIARARHLMAAGPASRPLPC